MADNNLFKPKSFPIRKPTETSLQHGAVLNPPRMMQIGGMDKLHEHKGHFKNGLNIKKPGGTR